MPLGDSHANPLHATFSFGQRVLIVVVFSLKSIFFITLIGISVGKDRISKERKMGKFSSSFKTSVLFGVGVTLMSYGWEEYMWQAPFLSMAPKDGNDR